MIVFESGLHIISTPIGCMYDITYRGVEALKQMDWLICEDAREADALLQQLGIKKALKHFSKVTSDQIADEISNGGKIGLLSDRGTPCISDPGHEIVVECVRKGVSIVPIPGVSAPTTLISVAGFGSRFLFYGFLPKKGIGKVLADLEQVLQQWISVVFFESPFRLLKTLEIMENTLSFPCEIVIGREMTKKFESFYRGKLCLSDIESAVTLKGEFSFVIRRGESAALPKEQFSDKKTI